ncbi:MAG: GNAT family N-acetyltransferase [Flavobacteriaceae bacterium]|nr:GNAT family N-acetyltransferase [Flavobacteriaceae bacterium]
MKITYTRGEDKHLKAIVALFELCLFKQGGSPSVEFWKWKHHENPAGVSPIILAWDCDRLIGIRAFMRYSFMNNHKELSCYRAVDTAIHPAYRGRGIFTKLTMQLVQQLAETATNNFIFNTPNEKSKSGYLKMGWEVWGKPTVFLWPYLNFNPFLNNDNDIKALATFNFETISTKKTDQFVIYKDKSYFKWRYQDIPIKKYGLTQFNNGNQHLVVIYHKIRRGLFAENRICDIIKNNEAVNSLTNKECRLLSRKLKGHFITYISSAKLGAGFSIQKWAPEITYRNFQSNAKKYKMDEFNFNLAELELF